MKEARMVRQQEESGMTPVAATDTLGRAGYKPGRVFTFDLPVPPLLNHYYRTRAVVKRETGRPMAVTYLSKQVLQYRETVDSLIPQDSAYPLTARLSIDIRMYWPTRHKWDIDNPLKGLMDALQHAGIVEDDTQFDILRITRGPVRDGGRCLVTVTELIPLDSQMELHLL